MHQIATQAVRDIAVSVANSPATRAFAAQATKTAAETLGAVVATAGIYAVAFGGIYTGVKVKTYLNNRKAAALAAVADAAKKVAETVTEKAETTKEQAAEPLFTTGNTAVNEAFAAYDKNPCAETANAVLQVMRLAKTLHEVPTSHDGLAAAA